MQNSKLKVVFLGTSDFVQPIREVLKNNFILTNSLNEADLGVVASYGKILTQDELSQPKYGCINVHPSLLPKYRGPTPIQNAILNEDQVSGITIIKMDEQIDHGPIIYQEVLELSDRDNFDILSKKMFLRASEILPQIIEDFISGKIKLIEQNHSQVSFSRKLTKEDGYFDINTPPSPESLDIKIRAYYPWPTAWTKWKNKIVRFLPGNLIQMEGKKPISLKEFFNGYPDFPLIN